MNAPKSSLMNAPNSSLVLGYVAFLGMGWNKKVIDVMISCHTVSASPVMWYSGSISYFMK